jgi:hypothetical protein
MRTGFLALIAAASLLAGCAHHGMNHGAMSQDEMMRHCQMMEQHGAASGHDASHHDPAQHGGMSHEEMQRHCEAMRAEQPSSSAPYQH